MRRGYDVIDCRAAFGVNREHKLLRSDRPVNIWILPALQTL